MRKTGSLEPECFPLPESRIARLHELLQKPEDEQRREGYFDTLHEICQQPATLLATRDCMLPYVNAMKRLTDEARCLILTGSGSSEYVGVCVRLPLQSELRRSIQTVGSGTIVTHGSKALSPERPAVMVSVARSGDSPESVGAVSLLLETDPGIRHLIVTCNGTGKLAERFRANPRVLVAVLDDRTNDRSLVMTSSFTSLVMALRLLGMTGSVDAYSRICAGLSSLVHRLLDEAFDRLAKLVETNFCRAVFLGSGARYGGAREAALKMLEMTAGRVGTLAETYLGLRHGPMSFVHADSLIVCFLSCDPTVRAYEADLIRELDRKKLGLAKVIVGEDIPQDLIRAGDVAVECQGLRALGDANAPVIDVVVGQMLAFSRCLAEGLQPDSPSEAGVINRVVESFELHREAK